MWFGAIKLALNAGTHIYKKRQETKMAMADAQHMHARKMASGEETYQGKLLEARQNDYKDEVVLAISRDSGCFMNLGTAFTSLPAIPPCSRSRSITPLSWAKSNGVWFPLASFDIALTSTPFEISNSTISL